MVDIIKIAMMVVALILVVLIPVVAFFHFRKKPQLSQGLLWGLISFLAFYFFTFYYYFFLLSSLARVSFLVMLVFVNTRY